MALKVSLIIFSFLIANFCAGYKSCGRKKECVPRHLLVDGTVSRTDECSNDIRFDDNNGCSYNELCCHIPNKPVIPAIPKEQHIGCGWSNIDDFGFRNPGETDYEAQFGEFPWMVAILSIQDVGEARNPAYVCGGSLIAPNVVLTGAHCVNKRVAHQLVVRGGEWDSKNINKILSHVDRSVKEMISHEKYHKGALYNDVALLILDEPFVWQENIRPICLPESNVNFDHSRCYAAGGSKNKEGKYQAILRKVDLPVVPHDTCQDNLRQTRLGVRFTLHDSFLCAGGEKGKDTCNGYGGSPLVCPIPGVTDRYYQAGIVAWGIGCAEKNVPGVYANIPYLRPWISEKLAARGIQFLHFTP